MWSTRAPGHSPFASMSPCRPHAPLCLLRPQCPPQSSLSFMSPHIPPYHPCHVPILSLSPCSLHPSMSPQCPHVLCRSPRRRLSAVGCCGRPGAGCCSWRPGVPSCPPLAPGWCGWPWGGPEATSSSRLTNPSTPPARQVSPYTPDPSQIYPHTPPSIPMSPMQPKPKKIPQILSKSPKSVQNATNLPNLSQIHPISPSINPYPPDPPLIVPIHPNQLKTSQPLQFIPNPFPSHTPPIHPNIPRCPHSSPIQLSACLYIPSCTTYPSLSFLYSIFLYSSTTPCTFYSSTYPYILFCTPKDLPAPLYITLHP